MKLMCTICGVTDDYRAVVEFPIHCNACGKGFTPGDGFDRSVSTYEMWKNKPKVPVLPDPPKKHGPTPGNTTPGTVTPRARTIRPQVPGSTRERVKYLVLDVMEVDAIERIQAMLNTNRDYPDRNRDILLIGIAERLERMENMLAMLPPPSVDEDHDGTPSMALCKHHILPVECTKCATRDPRKE